MCEEAVYDVVALGELLIDFTPVSTDGAGCPTLKANPGGAPGNLLAALSRYGRRTAFLGKVGEDAFGRLLLESLRRAGVQTRGIRLTSSAFTTLAFVTLDAAGDRSFSFARKPGADTQLRWEEVDRSLIQRCRLFHFGSLSLTDEPARSATRAAVAYARELGRTVTFDPNLRLPLWPSPAEARAQILWSLCQADVVKLSDEEVDFLWGCSPQEGARRLLEECGVSLAMVTLGPRGCYLQNRRGSCALTAPQVSPVDTTGAGDIFGGAPSTACWTSASPRRSWTGAAWRRSPALPSPPPASQLSTPAASPASRSWPRWWPGWESPPPSPYESSCSLSLSVL